MTLRTKSHWFLAFVGVAAIALWFAQTKPSSPVRRDIAAAAPPARAAARAGGDWQQFALLLIDVQQDFFTTDLQTHHADYAQTVAELLAFCREEGIEVIHLRTEFASVDELPSSYKAIFQDQIPCLSGSPGVLPTSFAQERPGEPVFYKSAFNGFSVDALPAHLRAGGKRHVLIAGLTTDLCVFATLLGALDKGYLVSVVDDCCLAYSDPAHRFIVQRYGGFLFDTVPQKAIKQQQRVWLEQLELLDRKALDAS